MASQYWQKLKDPRWQRKRLEAMEKADFTCEICGDSESTLNVHHKEYFKGHEPWEYLTEQLCVLCESCHEAQHEKIDVLKMVCSTLPLDGLWSRNEIAMILAGFCNLSYKGLLEALDAEDCGYIKTKYDIGMNLRKEFGY